MTFFFYYYYFELLRDYLAFKTSEGESQICDFILLSIVIATFIQIKEKKKAKRIKSIH